MDIFLIDLEQPNRITKSVVAWRHYFVANEFAELQAEERYISPEVTLIWFVFLWVGLGWQHVIKAEPDYSVVPDETKVTNILLELFFAGSLFFIIGYVQIVLHRINAVSSSGSAVTGFVDLCTLANVSLLMFDEQAHGYYIHAQAPWRSSDIPLVDLSRELQNEEKGKVASGGRGLKEHQPKHEND
jgi:meckelin